VRRKGEGRLKKRGVARQEGKLAMEALKNASPKKKTGGSGKRRRKKKKGRITEKEEKGEELGGPSRKILEHGRGEKRKI